MSFFIKLFLCCLFVLVAICTCPNSCSGHGTCETNGVCKCADITSTGWGSVLNAGYTGPDCSLRTCPVGASVQTIPVVFRGTVYPHPIDGKRRLAEVEVSTMAPGSFNNTFKVGSSGLKGIMGVEGGILRCSRDDNGAYLGTANVLAFDGENYAIIQYNFNLTKAAPINENITLLAEEEESYDYSDYIQFTVCSVYSTRNDMTYYKSLTTKAPENEGDKYTINPWEGYAEIFKLMGWNSESTTTEDEAATPDPTQQLRAACYVNGEDESISTATPSSKPMLSGDGKAYVYFGDLDVTIEDSSKDVKFEISNIDNDYSLTKNTVCYIMAKGNGDIIKNLAGTDLAKKLKKDDKGEWYYEVIMSKNTSVVDITGETVEMKLPKETVKNVLEQIKNQTSTAAGGSGGDGGESVVASQPTITLPLPATSQEKAVIEVISMPGTPVTIDFGDAGILPNTIIGVKPSSSGSGDRRLLFETGRELAPIGNYNEMKYVFGDAFPDGGITDFVIKFDKVGGVHSPIECSGQGLCNRETGSCECYNGFTGEACQRMTCPNNCNNHGQCVTSLAKDYTAYGEGNKMIYYCQCDAGFRGPDCSLKECPSSPNNGGVADRDCSNNGLCDYSTGLCSCFEGYYGEGCQFSIGTV